MNLPIQQNFCNFCMCFYPQDVLKFSPSVIFITYAYSDFVVFCWIILFVLFSCRIRQWFYFVLVSMVFFRPRFDFCTCTSDIFFINKQFRICANAFPNKFTVRSYEYCMYQHWILYWMQENQTATYFLRSRLFTYDIMKNFNCN
jgi:hypothetical protein